MSVYTNLNRPILVVDYDLAWPVMFEQEKAGLLAVLGTRAAQIEHFGSTAIPGLAAKPVIDIAVGLRSLVEAAGCIPVLESIGYIYQPEVETALPGRRFLWKGDALVHTFHLHVCELGSPEWVNPLRFRDYLRVHPDEVQRYADLKRRLAAQHGSDIGPYIDGKAAFVQEILKRQMICGA